MPINQEDGNLQYECEQCNTTIETDRMIWNCPSCHSPFKDYNLNCYCCKRSVLQKDIKSCYVCNGRICKECISYYMCSNHLINLPVETKEKIKKYHGNFKVYNIISSIFAILILISLFISIFAFISFIVENLENLIFGLIYLFAFLGIEMGIFMIIIKLRNLSWDKFEKILDHLKS